MDYFVCPTQLFHYGVLNLSKKSLMHCSKHILCWQWGKISSTGLTLIVVLLILDADPRDLYISLYQHKTWLGLFSFSFPVFYFILFYFNQRSFRKVFFLSSFSLFLPFLFFLSFFIFWSFSKDLFQYGRRKKGRPFFAPHAVNGSKDSKWWSSSVVLYFLSRENIHSHVW
jgi:hypothetical protein